MYKELALLIPLVFVGCVSVPKEAPELSAELGRQINTLERSHDVLLTAYFDGKRDEVDRMITQTWIPMFAKTFFSKPAISEVWKQVVTANTEETRLKFILHTAPTLQLEIDAQRTRMYKPLNMAEALIRKKLMAEYGSARAVNNSITSFLVSSSKVDENRARYLSYAGLPQADIDEYMSMADDAVSSLSVKAGKIEDADYFGKLEELQTKIKGTKDGH
jgi:hypothetical protein